MMIRDLPRSKTLSEFDSRLKAVSKHMRGAKKHLKRAKRAKGSQPHSRTQARPARNIPQWQTDQRYAGGFKPLGFQLPREQSGFLNMNWMLGILSTAGLR